jgi:hypothetical protein
VKAEYQHGSISGGHDAYNFAPALRRSRSYCETLPRHLLTYGSWWGEQVDAPVNRVVIGNPHREYMLAQFAPSNLPKRDVLLLSDGIEFHKYVELAQCIESAAASRGLRLVIRPHPLERTEVKGKHGERIGNIVIDGNGDLYASLQTAHAVISELSTGLFEAVGLADRFFMWETAKARFAYPSHPFQSFQQPEQLLELLLVAGSGRSAVPSEAIWAPSWRPKYQTFLDESLAAGGAPGELSQDIYARVE